ncbi:hypothetical protein JCM12298_28010 [Desulfothermus naphthae]
MSEKTFYRDLQQLVEIGILKAEGEKKGEGIFLHDLIFYQSYIGHIVHFTDIYWTKQTFIEAEGEDNAGNNI